MAVGGRLVLVGLLAGATAEVNPGALLMRRLTLRGTVLWSRPLEEKISLAQAFERQVLPLFAAGKLKPVVGSVTPLSRIREAAERMAAIASMGKLVLAFERAHRAS